MNWILIGGGWLLAAYAGVGSQILREFSVHELEELCLRRNRPKLFDEILARHDRVVVTADCLLVAGILLVALGVCREWLSTVETDFVRSLALTVLVLLGLLGATVWFPLALGRLWAEPLLMRLWPWWKRIHTVCSPLSGGVAIADALLRRLSDRPEEESEEEREDAFQDEIRTMVSAGQREGLLEPDAREMIEGVMDLEDVTAAQIMTPRSRVDALDVELPWNDVLRRVSNTGRTRIPVYEGTIDRIVGVLYVKDLLKVFSQNGDHPPLTELLREAKFVTATKAVDDLLQEFLRQRIHLAVVLDEFQRVAGVVTIEDALEEIVGEIVDESDREEADHVRLNDQAVEALGRARLDELNDELGLALPEPDDVDTIAGLVISRLGRIPRTGQTVRVNGIEIKVLEANRRRIERVRLEREAESGDAAVDSRR